MYPHHHQPPPPYLPHTSVFAISPTSTTPYHSYAPTGGYITTPSEPTSTPGSSSSTGHTHSQSQFHNQQYDDVAMPGTPPTGGRGGTGTIRRGKTGCLTCRIRKKRCDEAKPTCNNCARLELECMGYSVQRPGWLKEKDMEMRLREEIKQKATERRRTKKTVQPKGTKTNLKTKQKQKQKQKSNTNTDREDANPDDQHQVSPGHPTESMTEMDDQVEVELMDIEQEQDTSSSSSCPPRFLSLPTTSTSRDPPGPSAPLTWRPLPPRDHFATAFPSRNPWDPSQSDHVGVPYPGDSHVSPTDYNYTYPPQYPPSNLPNPDSSLEDLWIYLLNSQPDILSDLVSPSPIPHPSLRQSPAPHSAERYFNHYMNVVLPLQFKFVGTSITDLLASLAMRDGMVMEGLKALGALHLSVYRKKRKKAGRGGSDETRIIEIDSASPESNEERDDGDVATTSFDRTIQTLRSRTTNPSPGGPQPQSSADADAHFDGLLVSSIAPISYIIFSGGISPQWVESLDIARKYLFRALKDSPELGIFVPSTLPHGHGHGPSPSPWKKYKIFLQAMIRTDIAGSITENKASELLPIYRSLLNRSSIDFVARNPGPGGVDSPGGFALEGIVPTMGAIDNTTLLALAEIVALSQWRTESLKNGTLDIEELVQRGHEIKILLNERSWREKRISISSYNSKEEKDREEIGKLMSDCQYESARLFLAITVNGPFPKIKGVMEPILRIVDLIGKLKVLENKNNPTSDIRQVGEEGQGKKQTNEFIRALIFPIAISACHCVPSLQGFFRSLFLNLDRGALMFGNTKYVWMLIEKVWERRNHIHRAALGDTGTNGNDGGMIDWLDVMKRDLGWEKGILLI